MASTYHPKKSLVAVWKSAAGLLVGSVRRKSIFFFLQGLLKLMFSAFKKVTELALKALDSAFSAITQSSLMIIALESR